MLFTKHFFCQRKLILCYVAKTVNHSCLQSMGNGTQSTKLHVKRGIKWNNNVLRYTNKYFQTGDTAAVTSVPSICLCCYPLFSYTRLTSYPCTQTVCLIVDRDDLTESTLPSAHCCTPHPSLAIQTVSYPTQFTPTLGMNGLNILILHYTYATKTFNRNNLL